MKHIFLVTLLVLLTTLAACSSDVSDTALDDPVALEDVDEQVVDTPESEVTDEQELGPIPSLDDAFHTKADAALAGVDGAYLEIINNGGGDYYASSNNSNLDVVGTNGDLLFFKTGGMMPHTFGFRGVMNEESREYECVDPTPDEATNNYDVFGFKHYTAPNVLKPFDNSLCDLTVDYSDGVYTGYGAARTHYYSYNQEANMTRDMRFKFVYSGCSDYLVARVL